MNALICRRECDDIPRMRKVSMRWLESCYAACSDAYPSWWRRLLRRIGLA